MKTPFFKVAVFVLSGMIVFPFSARSEEKETTLYGRVSQAINQHITGRLNKETVYIDVEGGDQIVAYVATPLRCNGRVELTGKMIEVRGPAKRLGQETKLDDSYVERQMDVSRWRCLQDPIDGLADASISLEQKKELRGQVVKRGKESIPVLIEHLGDKRPYKRGEDVQNYYNLPPNRPMPPPLRVDVSIGDECQNMLYDIITPKYASPYAEKNGKPFSFSILSVPDWKVWWEKNNAKNLEQIHEELKPLIDRYWQQHGTEQVVP